MRTRGLFEMLGDRVPVLVAAEKPSFAHGPRLGKIAILPEEEVRGSGVRWNILEARCGVTAFPEFPV
jgi:hypothetical protein